MSRGVICAIYGCNNYRRQSVSKSFYRFPKNEKICKQWVIRSRRADLDYIFKTDGPEHLNKSYVVCSDHFVQKDFRNRNLLSQGIWPGAIPSILPSAKEIDRGRSSKKKKERIEELESETTVGGEIEAEIKCEIEDKSLELVMPWETSGVECSSAFHMAPEMKSEPLSDDEGRNSNGNVAITLATAPDRTSFSGIFVKEEPWLSENEMEIPVTNKLNLGRNSNGDVAITLATAPDRTSFAGIFVKEEPRLSENEMEIPVTNKLNLGRNSNGDVAITLATAPDRTSFAGIFVKEEPWLSENEMEIPVTNKLNLIEVKGEPIEATVKEEIVETVVAADNC